MDMTLADSSLVADWTAAIGQALGALFTAGAVWVALRLANKEARQRREEEHAKARAQAKMVIVKDGIGRQQRDRVETNYFVNYRNIGDLPILGATLEARFTNPDNETFTVMSAPEGYVLKNIGVGWASLAFTTGSVNEIRTWRLFWQDVNGFNWEIVLLKDKGLTLREKQESLTSDY